MMKDYFAKYLPVAGEILPGDTFKSQWRTDNKFFHYVTVKEVTDTEFISVDTDVSYSKDDAITKVKLFLCSRLIQKGDILKECLSDNIEQVVHHFESVLPYGIYVFEPWPSNNENWIQANLAFRVMGSISPNAIWVKAGDEFTADEIKRYVIATDNLPVTPTPWGDELKSKHPDRYFDAFNILCSKCKTFH
jgi:hypothetical protein